MARHREMPTLQAGYILQHKVTSASSSGSLGFIINFHCVWSVAGWLIAPKWQSISIQENIVRTSVKKSHLRDTLRDTHGAIRQIMMIPLTQAGTITVHPWRAGPDCGKFIYHIKCNECIQGTKYVHQDLSKKFVLWIYSSKKSDICWICVFVHGIKPLCTINSYSDNFES